MTRYQAAKMPATFYGYKHLTVGDILPDATTKLYRRLFASSRKKYIPVKDVTEDRAGRELNAYLINPKYIDKAVVSPEIVSNQLEPRPAVRVIQYSRLTDLHPSASKQAMLSDLIATLITAARQLGRRVLRVAHYGALDTINALKRFKIAIHSPVGKTYTSTSGLGLRRRRKLIASSSATVFLLGAGLMGVSNLTGNTTTSKPQSSGEMTQASERSRSLSSVADSSSDLSTQARNGSPAENKSKSAMAAPLQRTTTTGSSSAQTPTSTIPATAPAQNSTPAATYSPGEQPNIPTPVPTASGVAPTQPQASGSLDQTVDGAVDGVTNTVNGLEGRLGL